MLAAIFFSKPNFFLQIPETPYWLLSKNKVQKAEKSLMWLRGWTTKQAIAHEFFEFQRHSERTKSCNSCIKQNLQCSHPPQKFSEKCAELKRKRTLKPFAIILTMFVLAQFSINAMRPFMVQIFKAYESQLSSDSNVIIIGIFENVANVSFMCFVRFIGRRKIYLFTNFGIFLNALIISCYGFTYLPSGYTSFDLQNQTLHQDNLILTYIPTCCLYFLTFFTYFGNNIKLINSFLLTYKSTISF